MKIDFLQSFHDILYYFFRGVDETAEQHFCETHELNMSTLRMTDDAIMQLKDLLCNIGFPEDSLHPQPFNYRGLDEQLDLVSRFCHFTVAVIFSAFLLFLLSSTSLSLSLVF